MLIHCEVWRTWATKFHISSTKWEEYIYIYIFFLPRSECQWRVYVGQNLKFQEALHLHLTRIPGMETDMVNSKNRYLNLPDEQYLSRLWKTAIPEAIPSTCKQSVGWPGSGTQNHRRTAENKKTSALSGHSYGILLNSQDDLSVL